mgnify:CR=1 FL=1|tara:strand:- start:841 stop:1929 length:1089 start_codon:yes stop_codon:yes gene_type:complete
MNYRYKNYVIEDFAEMTERYNTTKPVISKNHTREDNIKPVGRRSRKWEHMIKVSARKYMIYDGYCEGDPKFRAWWNRQGENQITEKETLALAPIMWTLSPQGDIETIRIRNGSGDYAHCARYTFLENTLPLGLRFIVHNGKQYIEMGRDKQMYLLPKSRYAPVRYVNMRAYKRKSESYSDKDDKKYLTFARKVGGDRYSWEVIGDTWDVRGARKQVNKKAKAEIKPYADAFYEWVTTMYRLIPFTDHEYASKQHRELSEWAFEQGLIKNTWELNSYGDSEKWRHIADEVFRDDQHPMRLHLAVNFLSQSNLNAYRYDRDNVINEPTTKEDVSRLRSQWNRYVNNKLGLVKKIAPEKIVKGEK